MEAQLPSPSPIDSRDAWVAAYHAWYYHYLAMQPSRDHLAVTWAHDMVRATLDLYLRDDRDMIRNLALAIPEPTPKPSVPEPREAPKHSETPAPGQISLFS